MIAFQSPTASSQEAAATNHQEPALDLGGEDRPTEPARQLSSAPGNPPGSALQQLGDPIAGPGRIDARNLLSLLTAALREIDCGVIACSSSEPSPSFIVFGRRLGPDDRSAYGTLSLAEGAAGAARAVRKPAAERSLLTLLFTDIVGSTQLAERLGDRAWHELLVRHHSIVRAQLEHFRGQEIDKAGDGFFATFDAPARAVRCAEQIRIALESFGIQIRVGIHTGECETLERQVSGLAVHVAARVAEIAPPGEILVSATVRELVAGSGLEFFGGDWYTLKGLTGQRQLFVLNRRLCTDE
jgi:class 3 adenylate cyclase